MSDDFKHQLELKKRFARIKFMRHHFGEIFHFPDNVPYYVIDSLFMKKYGYRDRLKLVLFFWMNGVSLPLFHNIIERLHHMSVTVLSKAIIFKMDKLWNDIDEQKYPQ